MTRRAGIAIALWSLACALPAGSAQAAPAAHHDNVATAINQSGRRPVSDFAWGVSRQRGGDVVDQLNVAHAVARCTDCRATAIAFQIVLVSGSPATVVPRNEPSRSTTSARAASSPRRRGSSSALSTSRCGSPTRAARSWRTSASDLRALARRTSRSPSCTQAVEREEARVRDVLANELVPRRTRTRTPTCSTRGCCRPRTPAERARWRSPDPRTAPACPARASPRARRRHRADRRVRGLGLQGAAAAGPPRRRPDDPALAAALPGRRGRRRPPRRRRGRAPSSRSATAAGVSAAQRALPRRAASCGRSACSRWPTGRRRSCPSARP